MYYLYGKRIFDIVVATTGLILALPLLMFISLLVRIFIGSPVLFCQERPGHFGQLFTICKFRTMTNERDANGNLLPDTQRLMSFGKFLRKTSLDELPELFNVIKGDMSLVGPRPLLPRYWARYTQEQIRRHEVKPGITGWAQVNGRNSLSWEEKFNLDVWYVNNYTLGLDIKIIVRTISKVLRQEGISQAGYATAEEFRGSQGKI